MADAFSPAFRRFPLPSSRDPEAVSAESYKPFRRRVSGPSHSEIAGDSRSTHRATLPRDPDRNISRDGLAITFQRRTQGNRFQKIKLSAGIGDQGP
jgi:hypothetical protein